MGAFHIADAYPKLVGFPLRLRPSHIGHSLTKELDHKWPPAFDAVRVDCKELGNSIPHELFEVLPCGWLKAA